VNVTKKVLFYDVVVCIQKERRSAVTEIEVLARKNSVIRVCVLVFE
jgi:hypothetical protein